MLIVVGLGALVIVLVIVALVVNLVDEIRHPDDAADTP